MSNTGTPNAIDLFGGVWSYSQGTTELDRVRSELTYLKQQLQRIQGGPRSVRTVAAVTGTAKDPRAIVLTPIGDIEIAVPAGLVAKLRPGSQVLLNAQDMSFVAAVSDDQPQNGRVANVLRLIDESMCEVEMPDGIRAVRVGVPVSPGERVIVDESVRVVYRNIGRASLDAYQLAEHNEVEWSDVIGQDRAKATLQDAIEGPVKHAELFARFGRRPVKGVLLEGPPGCGKTLLGRAAATALRRLHGSKASTGFLYVKGPEMLNKYVGASEANMRAVFVKAREHARREGFPAVVFIDEGDAVLHKRHESAGEGANMQRTMVPQFLAEMDGLDDAGCLVIVATNRPRDLDPAVVRDGRVDRKVTVHRPTSIETGVIIAKRLGTAPLDRNAAVLGVEAAEHMFDASRIVQTIRTNRGAVDVPLAEIVNGAIAAGVADRAIGRAIARAVAADSDADAKVTASDLRGAVNDVVAEYANVDLGDEVREFVARAITARAGLVGAP